MFENIAKTVRRLFGDEPATPNATIELAKRLQVAEAERSAAERNAQELRVKRAVTGRPTLSTVDEATDRAASLGEDCAALQAALQEKLERLPAGVSDDELAAEKASVQRADADLREKVTAAQRRMVELADEMIQIALNHGAQFFRGARTNYDEAVSCAVGHMSGMGLEFPGMPRIGAIDPKVFQREPVECLREEIKAILVWRMALSGPNARASMARQQLQAAGADDMLLALFDKTIAALPVAEVTEEVKPLAPPQRTGVAVRYLDPGTGRHRVACYGGLESAITAERGLRSNGMKDVQRGWSLEGGGFEPLNKPKELPVVSADVEADPS